MHFKRISYTPIYSLELDLKMSDHGLSLKFLTKIYNSKTSFKTCQIIKPWSSCSDRI